MVLTVLKPPKPFEKLPLFGVITVTLVKVLCIFYNTFLGNFKLIKLNSKNKLFKFGKYQWSKIGERSEPNFFFFHFYLQNTCKLRNSNTWSLQKWVCAPPPPPPLAPPPIFVTLLLGWKKGPIDPVLFYASYEIVVMSLYCCWYLKIAKLHIPHSPLLGCQQCSRYAKTKEVEMINKLFLSFLSSFFLD